MALGAALLFRLPFVPQAVVDWDESTFALMGDSLVRGHLPYTELWDNKPPLIFACFALVQLLFGKSIVAIRAAGIVLVAVAAWLGARAADRGFGLGRWSLAAIPPVAAAASLDPGSGALMSEHLALVFLAAITALLAAGKFTARHGLLLGLATSLAVLTRTNLAYPALLVGPAALLLPLAPGSSRARFVAAIGLGAAAPVLGLLVAYRNDLALLFLSVVRAPLAYAGGGLPFTAAWFREAVDLVVESARPAMIPAALGALAGALLAWRQGPGSPGRRMAVILVAGAAATAAGICTGGRIYGHYLVQLLPFAAPLCAVAAARAWRRRTPATLALSLAVAASWAAPLAAAYAGPLGRLARSEPLWNDPASRVTAYLEEAGGRGQVMFLAEAHVAYWLLDAPLPLRIAHPSELGRMSVMRVVEGPDWTTCGGFAAIFARHPAFVVLPTGGPQRWDDAAATCLDQQLSEGYRLERVIDNLRVFRRREDPGSRSTAAGPTP